MLMLKYFDMNWYTLTGNLAVAGVADFPDSCLFQALLNYMLLEHKIVRNMK